MEARKFKDIISGALKAIGFMYTRRSYYYVLNDLIFVIGLQKSGYANQYYINLGYIIRELHPGISFPRYVDADVRARFNFGGLSEPGTCVDLDGLDTTDEEKLKSAIIKNIELMVMPVSTVSTLKHFLIEHPVYLLQTTVKTKEFLGLK